ncbi:S9 family peptidase [Marinigracilibium pacificum]|uniref:Prolyl oligopeptidase family serine peptidase n=1 Tax=Marinigracilibium pacificum TaxID=2729599 RepID=A0A848ITP0_9BACT|nr:DPP IV N-terminal domain-containing protein [Marinigracilibium pacificum]NMM47853.1 prolyl oligopeptidase family serine peptidase [Marinigracilibium pacificum]
MNLRILFFLILGGLSSLGYSQESKLLTLDRIYNSNEFSQDYQNPISWIENGDAYIILEYNDQNQNELIKYDSKKQTASPLLSATQLTPEGTSDPIYIEDFTMSEDESKILIFTNSSRVWRTNTKGDYWVYDLNTNKLTQIGSEFPESSLMFAKFSVDNQFVAYVMNFNLYMENFSTGEITQLTNDGTGDIINGTFDWAYEEEFGARDGFRWSPNTSYLAYWQLDASNVGSFNMINNTDSIYSKVIPVQYPKVGQDPSSAKIGILKTRSGDTQWVKLEGSTIQNYIPAIQWMNENTLIIQQINRKQNHLKVWVYDLTNNTTRLVYEEKNDSWIDLQYPDVTASHWGDNDLKIIDDGKSFIRLTEDNWRNAYKINIYNGEKTMLSPGAYDVASFGGKSDKLLYYLASPSSSSQRYLYTVDLKGNQKDKRLTPDSFEGINNYNISPNGKYAIHSHSSALSPTTVDFISLPDHKIIKQLITNEKYKEKLNSLAMPEVEFIKVTTDEGIEVDGRMIKPLNFDGSKQYPVIFHVYGEPWGQVATDNFVGLWNIMLAQQGYIVIDIDPRGSPCLKGSEWRKSIYRNIGRKNINDLGKAAAEIVKFPFIDAERVGVWGWSGGGSSTLNLMFRFPEVFKTGVAIAFVANQLTYDNIYQERYMGLPQENKEDFINGSPISHVEGLKGDLLLIHGTADDNVHYQNMELLVNELISKNKQFDMMSYPNRSHGIYEGKNTRRHLYTLITNYFNEKVPVNNLNQ